MWVNFYFDSRICSWGLGWGGEGVRISLNYTHTPTHSTTLRYTYIDTLQTSRDSVFMACLHSPLRES